jgi:hypothetical protein
MIVEVRLVGGQYVASVFGDAALHSARKHAAIFQAELAGDLAFLLKTMNASLTLLCIRPSQQQHIDTRMNFRFLLDTLIMAGVSAEIVNDK